METLQRICVICFIRWGSREMGLKSCSVVLQERFKVPIYIGPTFYQRLKHNSEEKIHARGRGRKEFLTRQPNEGRQNGGGLRVGEMEKDALLAHSVPHVIVEPPHALKRCLQDEHMLLWSYSLDKRWCVQSLWKISTRNCGAVRLQTTHTRITSDVY